MSKIFVPNVVIGKTARSVLEYIEGRTTQQADILVSPKNGINRYLTHFEYNANYSGKSKQELILKFVDTDGNFENTFLNNSVVQKYLAKSLQKAIKTNQTFSKYVSVFDRLINSEFRVYVSFGIGDDTKSWCNPFTCILIKSEIDISNNGIRTFTYTFYPADSYLFRPKLVLDDTTDADAYSEFSFGEAVFFTKASIQLEVKDKDVTNIKDFTGNISVLLSKYIQEITDESANNIITILPDLNDSVIKYAEGQTQIINTAGPGIAKVPLFSNLTYDTESIFKVYKRIFGINAIKEVIPTAVEFYTRGTRNYARNTAEVMQQIAQKAITPNYAKGVYTLSVESNSKDNKPTKDPSKPNLPDWWVPLREITKGINTVLGNTSKIVVYKETDIKLLKLWASKGLIDQAMANTGCTIIGDSQMISDYLYCNQTDLESIKNYKSKYNFSNDDPVGKILNNPSYKDDLIKTVFKGKSSSLFNEKIIVDEFSYNKDQINTLNQNLDLARQTDLPVFLNNTKSSNVIGLSLDMQNTYFDATLASVNKDSEIFFSQLLIDNAGLIQQNLGIDFNQIILRVQQLINHYNLQSDFLFSSVGPYTDYFLGRATVPTLAVDRSDLNLFFDDVGYATQLGSSKAVIGGRRKENIFNLLGAIGYSPLNTFKIQNFQNKITTENENSLKFIHLLYMNVIQEIADNNQLTTITDDSYFNLSEFILSLNEANKASANMTAKPGFFAPQSATIQGKIFEYLYKFNTKLTLKTLPFFQYVGNRVIDMPCFVFSKKSRAINSTYSNEASDNIDFFSGVYNILGYRHIITSKDAYSEFTLLKNTLSQDDTQTMKKKSKP